jgi:hypothetical protein
MILCFNTGMAFKALLRFKFLYVSLDAAWDYYLFDSPFSDTGFNGLSVTPAIGVVYFYPVKND